ncbi:glycoside hydrolase family 6 protein [Labedella populi]|uniref:glycoside hydrolase family 6 protein n=1 Tax=Labedella populi TaxID=2498850 RepID=UPI00140D39AA|nr:glycoside hydrolase family 6 protein [Labedella populi]
MGEVRRRTALVLASVFVPVIVVAAGFVFLVNAQSSGPFNAQRIYVDPQGAAATAVAEGNGDPVVERVAATPTAVWLTPEEHGRGEVGGYVRSVVADAATTGSVPVFVVYGVPNRDCGNFSVGGLSPTAYPEWVAEIASSLGEQRSVVIVEPDSLSLAIECEDEDEQVDAIAGAVSMLAETTAWVYVDGGHSNWRSADDMAALLRRVGIDRIRGFSTNVSNFNPTSDERDYAETLSALVGGAHYVIDTSRNGAGSNGDWCNPSGRALGATPLSEPTSGAMDANLWVKAPGESDGACNGGPRAGAWWPSAVEELGRNAGW